MNLNKRGGAGTDTTRSHAERKIVDAFMEKVQVWGLSVTKFDHQGNPMTPREFVWTGANPKDAPKIIQPINGAPPSQVASFHRPWAGGKKLKFL